MTEKGSSYDFLCDFPLPDYPAFDVISIETTDYFTTASSYRISPLIMAINSFHFELSKFLLQNGASCNFADSQGVTPLMHAVKKASVWLINHCSLLQHSWMHGEKLESIFCCKRYEVFEIALWVKRVSKLLFHMYYI